MFDDLIEDELKTQEEPTEEQEEGSTQPFDEAQLLELAKNEGLLELEGEEESLEAAAEDDLGITESEQAVITSAIETIMFMSDKPVSLPKLRSVINPEVKLPVYRTLMARLREEFAREHRGVEIAEVSMGFQLRTKPHMSSILRKMVKTQPLKLTGATMEVLAIVAYKQPVTKDELDQIRGVDCGHVLRSLMEKRLVKIAGRSDLPGKPMIYGTTHEFLELFSLKDVKALPPLHEVEAMVAASEVGAEDKVSEAMDEFGRMIASSTKILFDDSQIDEELEALRSEIANIPTSTSFIDEQKARDKFKIRLNELSSRGLTLDLEGNEVPLETVSADAAWDYFDSKHGLKQEAPIQEAQVTEEIILATTTAAADAEVAIQLETPIEVVEVAEHEPSPELEQAAQEAQWERHAAMIAQAVVEAEVAVVNADAIGTAVEELKADHEQQEQDADQERDLHLDAEQKT